MVSYLQAQDGWIRSKQVDASGTAMASLTEAGWARLAASGKAAFVAALRERTACGGEPSPPRWRFVRRLRVPSDAPAKPLVPLWRVLDSGTSCWRGETSVSADLAVLDGHFPGEPIVPGVAQVYWAERAARQAFPGHAATGEVARLKFMQVIVPGVVLRLTLERQGDARVAFTYASNGGMHSSGSLVRRSL